MPKLYENNGIADCLFQHSWLGLAEFAPEGQTAWPYGSVCV